MQYCEKTNHRIVIWLSRHNFTTDATSVQNLQCKRQKKKRPKRTKAWGGMWDAGFWLMADQHGPAQPSTQLTDSTTTITTGPTKAGVVTMATGTTKLSNSHCLLFKTLKLRESARGREWERERAINTHKGVWESRALHSHLQWRTMKMRAKQDKCSFYLSHTTRYNVIVQIRFNKNTEHNLSPLSEGGQVTHH